MASVRRRRWASRKKNFFRGVVPALRVDSMVNTLTPQKGGAYS
jgi:hypothetical protein